VAAEDCARVEEEKRRPMEARLLEARPAEARLAEAAPVLGALAARAAAENAPAEDGGLQGRVW
jgi:hypothetical protein